MEPEAEKHCASGAPAPCPDEPGTDGEIEPELQREEAAQRAGERAAHAPWGAGLRVSAVASAVALRATSA